MSQSETIDLHGSLPATTDPETEMYLNNLSSQERIKIQKVPGVRVVLVVISSVGMVFDIESLRQKVVQTYVDAAVFFRTTDGNAVGAEAPRKIDLLIDFTPPGVRHQGWFYAKKLRSMARVAVGRNVGLFRKKIYDRVFDESKSNLEALPTDMLDRERAVQREVLSLAGIGFGQAGDVSPDRGKSIALELPPLSRM